MKSLFFFSFFLVLSSCGSKKLTAHVELRDIASVNTNYACAKIFVKKP